MEKIRTGVYLEPDLKKAIKMYCAEHEMTMTQFIEEACKLKLEQGEKLNDGK